MLLICVSMHVFVWIFSEKEYQKPGIYPEIMIGIDGRCNVFKDGSKIDRVRHGVIMIPPRNI